MLAWVADLLWAALALAGVVVIVTGVTVFRVGGFRLSMQTPIRPWLLALAVLLFRHRWLPQTALSRVFTSASSSLPMEEARLFQASTSEPWWQHTRRLGGTALVFTALVALMTWPQVRHLGSVPDLGDPLFSIWRISWVNHQIWRHPLRLFEANIFYPEHLTLTYSDPVLIPALMVAPLFWIGVHKVLIYNILFLSAFVLSGVTTFMFVQALTGRRDAALVSGTIFAVYPYRFEHYSHLELQMTMWIPLALWGLHRTLARGKLRDGILTGVAFALQMLSSLYYGVFLSVYLAVVGMVLWLGRGRPMRPLRPLAVGAVVAGLLIAPVASQYIANKPMMGNREVGTISFYSAEGPDYLTSHFRSWTYSSLSRGGRPERQLFPRVMPLVLSAVALCPPLSVARIAYLLGLVVAFDGSLGMNGKSYRWLHAYVPPFKGLRVPARFSVLVGLSLAVLSGFGAARLCSRWPRRNLLLTATMMGLVLFEAIPRMHLQPVPRYPPEIYAGVPAESVVAEFPMPLKDVDRRFEPEFLYFSTFSWHRLVNGDSGFFPPSYYELLRHEQDFPSDTAVDYLRARGVEYVAIHGALYGGNLGRLLNTMTLLDQRPDMDLVRAVRWQGSESRLYRVRHP